MELLNKNDILDLDKVFGKLKDMSQEFWRDFMVNILHFDDKCAKYMSRHCLHQMTTAMHKFSKINGMTKDFAKVLTKFFRMDYDEV